MILESSFKARTFDVSKFTGWGEKIEWKSLDDGLKEAKRRYVLGLI